MPAKLNIVLMAEAKDQALALLARTEVRDPTLCLMKGRDSRELEQRWRWGIYGRDNIEGLTPQILRLGHPLLYEIDTLIVAIPQFQLIPELFGKMLAVENGRLVVQVRSDVA